MKIISTSYTKTNEFSDPKIWLERISFYIGILEALAKEHQVVSFERINYKGEFQQNGVQYSFIDIKKRRVLFPWRMHRILKQLRPDVVLINGLVFPLQVVQLRWKLGRTVKIILIHRSEKPFNGLKKILQRFAGGCVNAYLFTSSEFGKQWIENGNIKDRNKIYEVMHGSSVFSPANKSVARSKLSISGSPVFLWVGRLNSNKDPVTVVKAFIDFISFEPTAKLYMIYQTGELLNEIKALINSNEKAREAIRLVGQVPHQELQPWYSSADFFISGSHYEGGGIALCEAMSCGCIPIVTDIISFRKMTGGSKCGLLFEPGNESDLLQTLLKTKELNMEKEREKVLHQFNEELSFEAIAGKINKIINSQ